MTQVIMGNNVASELTPWAGGDVATSRLSRSRTKGPGTTEPGHSEYRMSNSRTAEGRSEDTPTTRPALLRQGYGGRNALSLGRRGTRGRRITRPLATGYRLLARGRWSIENQLHWRLDVVFQEDQWRIRNGHAAENYSRLSRITINLLRVDIQDFTSPASVHQPWHRQWPSHPG